MDSEEKSRRNLREIMCMKENLLILMMTVISKTCLIHHATYLTSNHPRLDLATNKTQTRFLCTSEQVSISIF